MSYEELSIEGFLKEIKEVSDGRTRDDSALYSVQELPYHPVSNPVRSWLIYGIRNCWKETV